MKKFIVIFLFVLSFLQFAKISYAEELNAYFFYGQGCPHCAKEEVFLDSIKDKYPTLQINTFEVYYNKENGELMSKVSKILGVTANGVPFFVLGDKSFIGFSESVTPREIETRINECIVNTCSDSIKSLIIKPQVITEIQKENIEIKSSEVVDTASVEIKTEGNINKEKEKIIDVPFLGELNVYDFSLPFITLVLGLLDGFNPCAMWTLIFLISLLLGMENKKRMWTLGIAFIVVSGAVYFLFMSAWLNLILFLGFIAIVRIIIGLVALFGGGYSLREFFINKENVCKVGDENKKEKVFERLKIITKKNNLFIALSGIILLAFVVNLIELVCSAGLPAVYTQILAMNDLPKAGYYLYILLYIFFFMLDDLFVFIIAMVTLRMTGLSGKYARFSHLIGGTIMIIIGVFLIFKPEWLMFG
ncbi:TPA: hypothetical protein DIC38_00530 [Candidatus Nomurabacteria bacterium]|nr:MAG: hypothetical protein O210_OD1C00001G0624 [Parcubacteria bacterium RAAC4_OD1_1]HCY26157.1 hypothetical protein [Candidatus Nomurabacteria bacterium]